MLPASQRLRRSTDFAHTTRSGIRCKSGVIVLHALLSHNDVGAVNSGATAPPRVGVVVNKAVGNAVQRHRVARRIRHAMREFIPQINNEALIVLRALPGAGERSWPLLIADLHAVLSRAGLMAHR